MLQLRARLSWAMHRAQLHAPAAAAERLSRLLTLTASRDETVRDNRLLQLAQHAHKSLLLAVLYELLLMVSPPAAPSIETVRQQCQQAQHVSDADAVLAEACIAWRQRRAGCVRVCLRAYER